jgi:hypothetical protein
MGCIFDWGEFDIVTVKGKKIEGSCKLDLQPVSPSTSSSDRQNTIFGLDQPDVNAPGRGGECANRTEELRSRIDILHVHVILLVL